MLRVKPIDITSEATNELPLVHSYLDGRIRGSIIKDVMIRIINNLKGYEESTKTG